MSAGTICVLFPDLLRRSSTAGIIPPQRNPSTAASQREARNIMPSDRTRIVVDGYSFSEGELEWAKRNVPYLQQLSRSNRILYWTMGATLTLGILAYVLSFALAGGWLPWPAWLWPEFSSDLLYNLGITLWTSVVLAFLLEVIVDWQQRRAARYVALVRRALEQEGAPLLDGVEDDEEETAARLDSLERKLDLILSRLGEPPAR
jgi:hypothetical protein